VADLIHVLASGEPNIRAGDSADPRLARSRSAEKIHVDIIPSYRKRLRSPEMYICKRAFLADFGISLTTLLFFLRLSIQGVRIGFRLKRLGYAADDTHGRFTLAGTGDSHTGEEPPMLSFGIIGPRFDGSMVLSSLTAFSRMSPAFSSRGPVDPLQGSRHDSVSSLLRDG
jgi:hypothetical protein